MASGFLNSAGTDLDSLFYTDNGNAGALGFLISNGQDLGNRYIKGSLGYNVGYKNNAGTDIGFLRGNLVVPVVTTTISGSPSRQNNSSGFCYDPVTEQYNNTYSGSAMGVVLTSNINVTNGQPITNITRTIQMRASASRAVSTYCAAGSSSIVGVSASCSGCSYTNTSGKTHKAVTLNTSFQDVFSDNNAALSRQLTACLAQCSQYEGFYVRVKVTVSNAAGSNTYYSSEMKIG